MDLLSLSLNELEELVSELGEPKFRAGQIFSWLHEKRVRSIDEMTNLPLSLRRKLSEQHSLAGVKEITRQVSKDGTIKFLYGLGDGNCIETVAMFYERGISLCVSTEVGCAMGCRFCLSTKGGIVRKLTAGEILSQVYETDRILGSRITSVVMMGIGEPLDNYDASLRFMKTLIDKRGYGISGRSVSISTCGIVPRIKELADEMLPVTLSLSLHAATDEKRREIMPIDRKYPLMEAVEAARYYAEKTGRRVSYEYAVIHGWNDTPEDARNLAGLLGGSLAHLNLIPVNSAGDRTMKATRADAYAFMDMTSALGINTTVRRTLGADIDAACGQLRSRNLSYKEELK
ncbi:MAG: 23S rRNA (adenine(2503)-C(2))-methyltransferase RlmN [Oscillospiraceae bacterium]|jgi:23S rRNA (adenine2503-C2)-methyltransferase